MPYIKEKYRKPIDKFIDIFQTYVAKDIGAGGMNYMITRMLTSHIHPDFSYQELMECIGTLECVKLELYRRVGTLKEQKAMRDNGDIKEYGLYSAFNGEVT